MINLPHKLAFVVMIGVIASGGHWNPLPAVGLSAVAGATRFAGPVAGDRCPWVMYVGGGGGGGGQEFIAPASAASSAVMSRLRGHKDAIATVAYSPDGRLIATSDGNDVRIWDAASGSQRFVLTAPDQETSSPLFSPDGKWVATRSGEVATKLWNTETGRRITNITNGTAQAFSPDSLTVAVAVDGAVQLYDVKTGTRTRVLENAAPPVSFSPNGKIVATIVPSSEAFGLDSFRPAVIVLWNVATGVRLRELAAEVALAGRDRVVGEKGHARVSSMVFSGDGNSLLSLGDYGAARLWDVATGRHLRCFRTEGYPDSVPVTAYSWAIDDSPALVSNLGGKLLAVSPNGPRIYVWNASTNRIEETIEIPFFAYEHYSPRMMTLSLGPNGPRLLTWSYDSISKPGRTALVWDLVSAQLTGVLRHPSWLTAAALSPNANRATIAYRYDVSAKAKTEIRGEGEAWIWDLDHANVTLAAASGEFLVQGLAAAARKEPGAQSLLRKAQALNPDSDFRIEPAEAQRAFAGTLVTAGNMLAQTGDLEAATSTFEQVLNLDPTLGIVPKVEARQVYAEDLKGRGEVLAQIGEYEAAVANFQQAAALDPTLQIDPELDAGWEAAQAYMAQGEGLAQTGDIEGAAAKFREAQLLDPTLSVSPEERAKRLFDAARAQDLVARAEKLAQAGELKEAADTYWRALALDPMLEIEPDQKSRSVYGMSFEWQGDELADSGDTQGATVKFRQALAIDPTLTFDPADRAAGRYSATLVILGNQLAYDGDIQGAMTKYRQALAIDPTLAIEPELEAKQTYASFLERTGSELARGGNLNSAVATYRHALELDPTLDIKPEQTAKENYAGALVEEGRRLAEGGDLEGAAQSYRRALALDSTLTIEPQQEAKTQYASAIVSAADTLAGDGRIERAVAQYRAARRLDPTLDIDPVERANQQRASVLVWRARDLAFRGSLAQAAEKYAEALALDPTLDINPEMKAWEEYAHSLLSEAGSLVLSGVDDAAAVAYLERAVELVPNISLSASDLKDLCWWGSLLSRDPRFLVPCDEAEAGAQNDISVRVLRAMARALTGDFTGAIADLQFAIQQEVTQADKTSIVTLIQLLQSGRDASSIFTPSQLIELRQWR